MLKPKKKDYATYQEWVAATQKYNASIPKRKDFKTHAEWVNAMDAFNKKQKELRKNNNTKKTEKPIIKSIGKTDYNVSTESGKKAYEEALKKSKVEDTDKDKNLKKKYKQVSGEELKLKIKEIKEQQEKNKKKKVNVKENEEKKKKVVVEENQEKKKKVVVEPNKDKKDKLKVSKFIRNPKTKTLVRRTSHKGKQLLKLQERIKKRNKRLFGK